MENQIEIYKSTENQVEIVVQFESDTVWLNESQLGALFNIDRTVIGRHLKNIFKENELDEKGVCANFAQTTKHGAIQGKTNLKNIEDYRLEELIIKDLTAYPDSGFSEIHQRIGLEINQYKVK
ncbi:MAG: hypothetical protein J0M25_05855 [Flavobacteriales bacterium]|nr:hypothetical protein [Flavobacteriales bacterium]